MNSKRRWGENFARVTVNPVRITALQSNKKRGGGQIEPAYAVFIRQYDPYFAIIRASPPINRFVSHIGDA